MIKKIKAWAIVDKFDPKERIDSTICSGTLEIYPTKEVAMRERWPFSKVIPVLISFPQRSSKKIK